MNKMEKMKKRWEKEGQRARMDMMEEELRAKIKNDERCEICGGWLMPFEYKTCSECNVAQLAGCFARWREIGGR